MMSWYTNMLTMTVVYWAPLPGNDGYGDRSFVDPVELDGRWVVKQKLFINSKGAEALSKALVHVNVDVVLEGYLFLGDLTDLSSADEADPQLVDGAHQIEAFKKTYDTNGGEIVRRATL